MELGWLQSALVGFFAGFAEVTPLSTEAHLAIWRKLFGQVETGALFSLACHTAVLVVLLMKGNLEIGRLRRAQKLKKLPPKRRSVQPDLNSVNTVKLLKTVGLFAVLGRLLSTRLTFVSQRLYILAIPLALSGILMWYPSLHPTGNKDGRHLNRVDAWLMGAAALFAAIPGVPLIGAVCAVAALQGLSKGYALRVSWLLLCLTMLTAIFADALGVIGGGFDITLAQGLTALLGGGFAAVGSYVGISIMYTLVRTADIGSFCYYNWGMALLALALFLFV